MTKNGVRVMLVLLTVLAMGLVSGMTAARADTDPVPYLDENGVKQNCDSYTTVTDATTWNTEGWYVVNSNVTFDDRVTIKHSIYLILCDDVTLTFHKGVSLSETYNSITIYSQSTGAHMGKLVATGQSDKSGIYVRENITINGGTVTATCENSQAIFASGGNITINGGIVTGTGTGTTDGVTISGIHADTGNIEIKGGTVNASGRNDGIRAKYSVTINGGTVTATGSSQEGIHAYNGDVKINGGTVTASGGSTGIHASNNVTITNGVVKATGSGNPGNGISVDSGKITIQGGTVEATGEGENSSGITTGSTAIEIEAGSVIATGRQQGIGGSVINAIDGFGWTDPAGTMNRTLIAVSTTGQTLEDYKKLQFPAAFTVTYDGNGNTGGKAPTDANEYKTKESVTVLGNTSELVKTGYTFDGWNTKKDGTGTDYAAGDTFAITDDTTLYAQWEAIPAKKAEITKQPKDLALTYGYTEGSLSVDAEAAEEDKYQLSYQWYSCENAKKKNAKEIKGATKASYIFPTGKNAGVEECYYCTVTATRKDNGETATVDSDVAIVTVKKADAAIQTVPTANNRTYDGTEKPLLNSDGKAGGGTLVYAKGTDATAAPAKGQYTEAIPTATEAGTYYVWYKIAGDENHNDTVPACVTVTIAEAPVPPEPTPPEPQKTDISKAKISAADQEYTGKEIKPKLTVKLNGKKLTEKKDYTAAFKFNKEIGKASVTITGTGDYTGTATGSFLIVPKKVASPKLTAEKGKKETLTLSWKAGKGIDGYEIEYGLKRDFKGAKKIKVKGAKNDKYEIKKLTAKKTYYVRIRTWKKVKGKTYYSVFSKTLVKKVK